MNTKVIHRKIPKTTPQDLNKKVLFLYASLDSGHQKAAQAIREILLMQARDVETMDIEALRFSYPNLGKLVHKIYMSMAVNLSRFYDFLWDNISIEKRVTILKKIVDESSLDKFEKLFASFPAKVAVCTQALPCGFLSALKRERKFSFKLIAVITDYDVHAYWIYENVDIYCVATSGMREKLIKRGVPEERIRIIGIPVRFQFAQGVDPYMFRDKLRVGNGLPSVLIMGGSYGVGPLAEIIINLDKMERNFNMMVIVGKNENLYKKLQQRLKDIKKPIELFGYIENVSNLMQASDVLITKPGGLTISEGLCFGMPMIITRGVRGQESGNFNYLINNGVAVGVEKPKEVAEKLNELLNNGALLRNMSDNAFKLAKPDSAAQISRLIRDFL